MWAPSNPDYNVIRCVPIYINYLFIIEIDNPPNFSPKQQWRHKAQGSIGFWILWKLCIIPLSARLFPPSPAPSFVSCWSDKGGMLLGLLVWVSTWLSMTTFSQGLYKDIPLCYLLFWWVVCCWGCWSGSAPGYPHPAWAAPCLDIKQGCQG